MEEDKKRELVYIVTGVSGYLGSVIARYLCKRRKRVVGLMLPGEKCLFSDIKVIYGNIKEKESLRALFDIDDRCIVIHCAGMVSVSSFEGLELWNTNVIGTRNMVDLAIEYMVEKFIYVSSVHAIPEKSDGQLITEIENFSIEDVIGDYAKTKSAATQYVLEATRNKGLPACVVHPSGIIGPYDTGKGMMSVVLKMYLEGRLLVGVSGGYDFVDVRDVAEGVLSCCKQGKNGASYILSGHYYSIREIFEMAEKTSRKHHIRIYIPAKFLGKIAEIWETLLYKLRKKTIFTPYSVYTLQSNGNFSHERATTDLKYTVRSKEETIIDMTKWLTNKM